MAKKEKPLHQRLLKSSFSQKKLSRDVKKIERKTLRHTQRFVMSRLENLQNVKRQVLGWLILVIILVGVSLTQWLAFRNSYVTEANVAGGTYSEGVLGPLETLNPIFAKSSAEKSVAKLLFASLYDYDSTGNLKGDLAESVTVSPDETKYVVKLLPNIHWSDGAELNAHDVVFTVNLLKNPQTRASIPGWEVFKAEAIDDLTIKFSLPGAYAPFMHSLTFPILPEHILKDVKPAELVEHSFSKKPVTSGPFTVRLLQNITDDDTKKIVHLLANPKYRHGQPKLARFQLNIYPNREEIDRAIRLNEIIATPDVIYNDLSSDGKKAYVSRAYAVNDGVFALFNTKSNHLRNVNIRRALALSLDKEDLRSKISKSTAPLDGPILESQVAGDLPKSPKQDIGRALSLLKKEGWRLEGGELKKKGQQMSLSVVALKSSDFEQVIDELSKVWQEKLGIKVEAKIIDPSDLSQNVLQTVLQPRNYDVLVYEMVLGGDPDVYAFWHSSQASATGLNFANYSNVIADDALSSGRAKRDPKQRAERYKIFVKQWLKDVPAIALYQPKIDYIQLKSVPALPEDMKLVFPEDRFARVNYWTVKRDSVYKTP